MKSKLTMISAFLTVTSVLLMWLGAGLLIHQGRLHQGSGQLLFGLLVLTGFWFLYRSFKNPVLRTRPRLGAFFAVIAGVGIYFSAVLAIYGFQDRLVFVPLMGKFSDCENALKYGYEAVDLSQGGEHLRAYIHKTRQAKAWVFIFHGNAEPACRSFKFSVPLSDLPIDFALMEYPGYLDDTVSASQAALLKNAVAASDYFNDQKLPEFMLGWSLGSGVATYLASQRPSQGLVLVSPYTSISDVARHQYPLIAFPWMVRNPFPAEEWARKVDAPVLIIHGTDDAVIPISLGKEEATRFSHTPRFVEIQGGGHSGLVHDPKGIASRAIHDFIAERLR